MWGIIAGAAIGTGMAAVNKINNLNALGKQQSQLDEQLGQLYDTERDTSAVNKANMEASADQATIQSKSAAVNAASAHGQESAAAGFSGTTGGTVYSGMAQRYNDMMDNVNAVNESTAAQLQAQGLQDRLQMQGLKNQETSIRDAIDQTNSQLGWESSPWSWGMQLASGALSGAQMGMSAESLGSSIKSDWLKNSTANAAAAIGDSFTPQSADVNAAVQYGLAGEASGKTRTAAVPSILATQGQSASEAMTSEAYASQNQKYQDIQSSQPIYNPVGVGSLMGQSIDSALSPSILKTSPLIGAALNSGKSPWESFTKQGFGGKLDSSLFDTGTNQLDQYKSSYPLLFF